MSAPQVIFINYSMLLLSKITNVYKPFGVGGVFGGASGQWLACKDI